MNRKDVAILSGSLVCVALLGYFTYSTVSTVLKSKAVSQDVISQNSNEIKDTTSENNDKNSNAQESLNSRLEDASESSKEEHSKDEKTTDNSSKNSNEDEKETSKENTKDENSHNVKNNEDSSDKTEKTSNSKDESTNSENKDKESESSKENDKEDSFSKEEESSSNKNTSSSNKKDAPTFSSYLKNIETEKYTLKEDESLNDVAKKFKDTCAINSSLNILKSLNQTNSVLALETGDTILVPVNAFEEGTNYTVKEGDTWYNLARKHYSEYNHEVVIEFLMDVNPFSKEILPLGEEVFLPNF